MFYLKQINHQPLTVIDVDTYHFSAQDLSICIECDNTPTDNPVHLRYVGKDGGSLLNFEVSDLALHTISLQTFTGTVTHINAPRSPRALTEHSVSQFYIDVTSQPISTDINRNYIDVKADFSVHFFANGMDVMLDDETPMSHIPLTPQIGLYLNHTRQLIGFYCDQTEDITRLRQHYIKE